MVAGLSSRRRGFETLLGDQIKKNACDGEMVDAAAGEAVGLC